MSNCLLSLGVLNVGCKKSSSPTVSLNVNRMTESVINNVMKSVSTSGTKITLNQGQSVAIRGTCCDKIDISQVLTLNAVNVTKMSTEFQTSVANDIATSMNKELDNSINNLSSIVGSQRAQNLVARVKSEVKKITNSSKFKQSIKQSFSNVFGSQGQNVSISCSATPLPDKLLETGENNQRVCKISQELLMTVCVQDMFETIFKELQNNPDLATLAVSPPPKIEPPKEDEIPQEYDNIMNKIFDKNNLIVLTSIIVIPLIIMLMITMFS
jgi:hypothetical protein